MVCYTVYNSRFVQAYNCIYSIGKGKENNEIKPFASDFLTNGFVKIKKYLFFSSFLLFKITIYCNSDYLSN